MEFAIKELAGYGVLGLWLAYDLFISRPKERQEWQDERASHAEERKAWLDAMTSTSNVLGRLEGKLDK